MTESIARLRKLAGLESHPKVEVPEVNAEVQDHKVVIDPKTGAPMVSDETSITKSKNTVDNNKVPSPKLNIKEAAPTQLAQLTPQQTQAAVQTLSKALYGAAPTIAQQLGCTPQVAAQYIHSITSQNIASMTPTQAPQQTPQPPTNQPSNSASSQSSSTPASSQASTATPPAAVQSTPTSGL